MKFHLHAAMVLVAATLIASPSFAAEKGSKTTVDECDPTQEKCEEAASQPVSTTSTTEAVYNPQSDVEIYQAICIDPVTNRLWGRGLPRSGSDEGYGVPRPTARCQPDHDPAIYAPNGTWLK